MTPELVTPDPTGEILRLRKGTPFFGRVLVLPKSHYLHERRRLERTDRIGRQAAKQQTLFETTYRSARVLVDYQPQIICGAPSSIWSWNSNQSVGGESLRCPSLPEPFCRKPMLTGTRLLRALEGFDGEIWINGSLVASRWWPREPDHGKWLEFVRSAGIREWPEDLFFESASKRPRLEVADWRDDLFLGGSNWWQRLSNIRLTWLVCAVVLLIATSASFLTGQILSIRHDIDRAQAELRAKSEDAEDWLRLRRSALRSQAFIDRARTEQESAALILALLEVSDAINAQNQTIDSISLADSRMTIRLDAPGLENPVALITAMEDSMNWENVSYDSVRREIVGDIEF